MGRQTTVAAHEQTFLLILGGDTMARRSLVKPLDVHTHVFRSIECETRS